MNNKRIFATAIFFLLGIFMITGNSLSIVYADQGTSHNVDKEKSSDNKDDDKKSSDNNDNKDDSDNNKQNKEKEETKEDKSDKSESDNTKVDKKHDGQYGERTLAKDLEEQEKAAQEDAESKPDNEVAPQFPDEKPPVKHSVNDEPEWCDTSECTGPGSHDGKDTNCVGKFCFGNEEDKQRCKDNPNAEGCKDKPPFLDECHHCEPKSDGGRSDWCKHHKCNGGGHEDDDHKHHHNWCDHHNCHHHNHHTSTHFSDNHNGDVTVKVNLKYKEKNPKNLDDVELIIGDVYDKTLDLSDKPDTVKVDHLDIDGGDDFAVCLANEDSQEGECTVTEADNDHDNVEVWLDVK